MSFIPCGSHTVNMVTCCCMLSLLHAFHCRMAPTLGLGVTQRHHPSSQWKNPELIQPQQEIQCGHPSGSLPQLKSSQLQGFPPSLSFQTVFPYQELLCYNICLALQLFWYSLPSRISHKLRGLCPKTGSEKGVREMGGEKGVESLLSFQSGRLEKNENGCLWD